MFGSWPIATNSPVTASSLVASVSVSRSTQTPRRVPSPITSSTTLFQRNSIFGFANARSCMIFEAAQLLAAVHERDLVGEPGEEGRLFERGVAAADDRDLVTAEEEAVARRARGDAVAEQLALGVEAEHAGLRRRSR